MRFLKDNKFILAVFAVLPLSLVYLDGPVTAWVREFHRQQTPLNRVVSFLDTAVAVASHGSTLVIASLVILAAGRYFSHRRFFELGKALLISYISSGIVAQTLKHLIGRARPRVADTIIFIGPTLQGGYDSFPSGHTTVAFCFAYTLSRYLPRFRFLFYVLASVAGIGRIENTAHFFSDVVAGAAVGVITGKVIFAYIIPGVAARDTAVTAP